MSDYIKRSDMKAIFQQSHSLTQAWNGFDMLPSADVVERKRGEWIENPIDFNIEWAVDAVRKEVEQVVRKNLDDIVKRIAEQTEPSLEQFRVGLEYHTDATHFGKLKGESVVTNKTEPNLLEKANSSTTEPRCDTCNHHEVVSVECDRCDKNTHSRYKPMTDCPWK